MMKKIKSRRAKHSAANQSPSAATDHDELSPLDMAQQRSARLLHFHDAFHGDIRIALPPRAQRLRKSLAFSALDLFPVDHGREGDDGRTPPCRPRVNCD